MELELQSVVSHLELGTTQVLQEQCMLLIPEWFLSQQSVFTLSCLITTQEFLASSYRGEGDITRE